MKKARQEVDLGTFIIENDNDLDKLSKYLFALKKAIPRINLR